MSNASAGEHRVFNFNPGPSALPLAALEEIRDGFLKFGGMSVLEISHRSREFRAVLEEAEALLRELMGVPQGYRVLFLQGGASQQFAMVPMNLLERSADYAITGSWSKKAAAEAKPFGEARKAWAPGEEGFTRVPRPEEVHVSPEASYLHITTNNTIEGTQYHAFPDAGGVPLVADMSSDILSRPIDVSRFGLIYAGAQKNLGPAGVTVVVVRDDLAQRSCREVPAIFRYASHAENGSLYNTPPAFAIYAMGRVLAWIKRQGGAAAMERRNREKAALLYDVLDGSSFYRAPAERASRSFMNVVFTLPSEELTARFVAEAKAARMVGLAGHRSVGGIRASIYNACPLEAAVALAEFMREFERLA